MKHYSQFSECDIQTFVDSLEGGALFRRSFLKPQPDYDRYVAAGLLMREYGMVHTYIGGSLLIYGYSLTPAGEQLKTLVDL